MTNSIIKFLYKSQFVLDKTPTAGSTNPVTSDGILKALDNIASSKLSLVQSGYMADSVADKTKPFNVYIDNGIKLGHETEDQKIYEPAGFNEANKRVFTEHVIPAGTIIDRVNEIDIDGAVDCEVYICYDFLNDELVTLPVRTAVPGTVNVIQWMYAQSQDADGNGPRVGESSYDAIWWDFTENRMKRFGGTWTTNVSMSLPLAIGRRYNGVTTEIVQDFTMAGYCCKVTWVIPNASYIFPQGRKEYNGLLDVYLGQLKEVACKEIVNETSEPFQDYHLYLSKDGEIIGPSNNVSFNTTTGYYEFDGATDLSLCRYGYISADLINPENPDEKVYITSISPFDVVTVATSDDIEDLMRLINNQVQVELSGVRSDLDQAIADLRVLEKRVSEDEVDISEGTLEFMQTELNAVHKRQYKLRGVLDTIAQLDAIEGAVANDAYYVKATKSYYVYGTGGFGVVVDDSGYEVIEGTKKFNKDIVGNLNGTAKYCNKEFIKAGEIMPMGVKVVSGQSTYSAQTIASVMQTSVRIGSNYVTATNFNGTASKAKYADLAEMYASDKQYEPGTLVQWGGEKEITAAKDMVNGVVSTAPAYLMNSDAEGLPVALVGRVPVLVKGPVKKFDIITLSDEAGIGRVANDGDFAIARALEDNTDENVKLVECVVRFNI